MDDSKVNLDIEIPKDKSLNAVDGHKVVVILGKKINNTNYEGEVTKIIGHVNDPGVDILSIIYKYSINTEFPEDVREEVKNMPMEVRDIDMRDRRDLRDQVIFTIDGDDTKDIDDAISIKKLLLGGTRMNFTFKKVTMKNQAVVPVLHLDGVNNTDASFINVDLWPRNNATVTDLKNLPAKVGDFVFRIGFQTLVDTATGEEYIKEAAPKVVGYYDAMGNLIRFNGKRHVWDDAAGAYEEWENEDDSEPVAEEKPKEEEKPAEETK